MILVRKFASKFYLIENVAGGGLAEGLKPSTLTPMSCAAQVTEEYRKSKASNESMYGTTQRLKDEIMDKNRKMSVLEQKIVGVRDVQMTTRTQFADITDRLRTELGEKNFELQVSLGFRVQGSVRGSVRAELVEKNFELQVRNGYRVASHCLILPWSCAPWTAVCKVTQGVRGWLVE